MPTDDEFFTREDVDGQIDSLSRRHDHAPEASLPASRLVSHLRQFYTQTEQKQRDDLEQVWKRVVAEHQGAQQISQRKGTLISMQRHQDKHRGEAAPKGQPTVRKKRGVLQPLSTLAAVLFICLLVGSMIFVLNANRQSQGSTPNTKQSAIGSGGGTPLPKPPHPIIGGKCSIDTTTAHPQQSTSNQPGLYIFAQNQQSDNLLYRYDPQTQKVLWSIKLCSAFQSNGTLAQNGVLYLAGTDWTHTARSGSVSYLYALNETDGSAIWGVQFPTKVLNPLTASSSSGTLLPTPNSGRPSPVDLGAIATPTIANGIIYIVQRTGIVSAYNATTGSQLWTFNSGRTAWAEGQGSSPIENPSNVQVVNGVAYFSIVDRLYALNAQNGGEIWSHNFKNMLDINQSLAIDNDTIYLTAYSTVLKSDSYLYAFDAQAGTQKWVTKKLTSHINGPVAYGGQVHAMSYNGIWYTFNPSTGALEAQKTVPGADGIAPPVLINGVLYTMLTSNQLAVLNPDGSVKWSAQTTGQPVIEDIQGGIIYLSAQGFGVSAYRATNGKLLWHYEGYLSQPQGALQITVVK